MSAASVAKDWLKNTVSQHVVSPLLKYLVADIVIPIVVMLLLIIYVLIRRRLIGKKLAHQVTTKELADEADKVSLPEETAVRNQARPSEVQPSLDILIQSISEITPKEMPIPF